ncbi:uncharacterized protein LOC126249468 [Schistocerca nitens]|uniref:uncharacterized protein LOC126249468 n=1 Tax=Schistocerca nitens TaxID=7011 RepID=UPI0021185FE5|nr:uncharacterized protein LOC126249468 [Schistocerca nitens]
MTARTIFGATVEVLPLIFVTLEYRGGTDEEIEALTYKASTRSLSHLIMATNKDDLPDRFMQEYAKIRDRCFSDCKHSTRLYSELTPLEVWCIKYCIVNRFREVVKAKTKKSGKLDN